MLFNTVVGGGVNIGVVGGGGGGGGQWESLFRDLRFSIC